MEYGYRQLIQREFEARLQRNPRYSLRAFARDLNFLPSRLSDILNGKQGLSRRSATFLGNKLGFSDYELSIFVTDAEAKHARNQKARSQAKVALEKLGSDSQFRKLSEQEFSLVSQWYYFPILSLTKLVNFDSEPKAIAKRLDITVHEAKLALERLLSMGLLIKQGKKLVASPKPPSFSSKTGSKEIREYHSKTLKKADAALYAQATERRDFSAMTMAIDPKEIEAIREEIKKFRRGLEQRFQASPHKSAVYCLSIQFFELTVKGEEDEKRD